MNSYGTDLVFNKFNLVDLDKRYKCYDDFINYYEWGVYKLDDYYLIADLQTGEIVDTYDNKKDFLKRVFSQAIKYEVNELYDNGDHEPMCKATYDFYKDLVFNYIMLVNEVEEDLRNEEWLFRALDLIKEMEIVYNEK